MKPNHIAICVAVPVEKVAQMARLNKGNRTTTVNLAITTYLAIQGRPMNRYGVDCHYFRKRLVGLASDIDNYTPEELSRALAQLSNTASPCDRESINEEV